MHFFCRQWIIMYICGTSTTNGKKYGNILSYRQSHRPRTQRQGAYLHAIGSLRHISRRRKLLQRLLPTSKRGRHPKIQNPRKIFQILPIRTLDNGHHLSRAVCPCSNYRGSDEIRGRYLSTAPVNHPTTLSRTSSGVRTISSLPNDDNSLINS